MLKGTVNKILLFVVMSFCVLPLSAQDDAYNAYTPYSMFGIGDISKQGTAYNKSMGGVGIATRDKGHINILNPAAVTAREEKSFMADYVSGKDQPHSLLRALFLKVSSPRRHFQEKGFDVV